MINFTTATPNDVPQIRDWIADDPYHFHQDKPEWWLGDGALLAFCLTDEEGPLTFVRLDAEGELVRIHTQFGPLEEVSKRRLVAGILEAMKVLCVYYQGQRKGMVFNSVNPTLTAFMKKYLKFEAVGNDDYQLIFEVK